ncbi:MAG: sigma-54-dependent Fis family transcriptional regulator [Candidatus Binataceae bacterium]|nr:sigma-54-dependent Fis family transcriptional regulator [Candidatus Binataceae bacterium]
MPIADDEECGAPAAPYATPDLCVEFGTVAARRMGDISAIRIAFGPRARTLNYAADLVADSAHPAACFILSRALKLYAPFLTADENMFELIRAAITVARGPARIIVEGETGSGKESLIKLIHAASGDPASLVNVDCPALDEGTIGARLREALSQARAAGGQGTRQISARASFGARANLASLADPPSRANAASPWSGGTLFLNHLGELSPAAQISALEALGPSRGGHRPSPSPAAVRLLASSTQPLAELAERGQFQRALYDLFDVTLTIPPLRLRRVDIAMLARHYLRHVNPALSISPAAIKTLADYPFPGNVRELLNFITRLAIVPLHSGARVIGRDDIVEQLAFTPPREPGDVRSLWRLSHDIARREIVRRVLAATGGDTDRAAHRLGISSRALLRLTTSAVPRPRRPRGNGNSR